MKELYPIRGERFTTPLCADGSDPEWSVNDNRVRYSDTAWNGLPGLIIDNPTSDFSFELTQTACGQSKVHQIAVNVLDLQTTFDDQFVGGRIDPARWMFGELWNIWNLGNGLEPHNDNLINYHVPEIQRYTHHPSAVNADHPEDYGLFSGPNYDNGSLVAGASPLGFNPFSPLSGNGFRHNAVLASAAQQALMSPATTWLAGQIVQREELAQVGGYFEQTVTLPTIKGAFPGGWINEFFLPLEIDLFEAFRYMCEIHLNVHERPTVAGDYSAASDGSNGFGWAQICPCLSVKVPHKFAAVLRPGSTTDANGCPVWEVLMLVDGKLFARKNLVDPVGAVHHVNNLAVSGGASFIPGPPDVTAMSFDVHRIRTLQFPNLANLQAESLPRAVLTNATSNRGYANFKEVNAIAGDVINVAATTAPAGWTKVSSTMLIAGIAAGPAPASITMTAAHTDKKRTHIIDVFREAATGICVSVPSTGAYVN